MENQLAILEIGHPSAKGCRQGAARQRRLHVKAAHGRACKNEPIIQAGIGRLRGS